GGGRIRVREPVCGPVGLDRRPPDPGYTSFADARGAAGHEAEPGDAAVLLALLEREVEAEADAERRPHACVKRLVAAGSAERGHCGARRADARKDGEVRAQHVVRIRSHARVDAEAREGEEHGAEVPRAVVDDCDVHNLPLVDGMPKEPGASASRSAPPTALNAASAV